MIVEHVTIERDKIVVSYRGDDLSLTPEMEARLAAFWKGRIERITRQVLGDFGTSSGNALAPADVPEREQESLKRPICAFVTPSGNI